MNRVPLARRTQIINCLVEGNSIRSTERMTGTHRDTICRLLVEVGAGCAALMDDQMCDLSCRRIQVDEIWAYVAKKQAHLAPGNDRSRQRLRREEAAEVARIVGDDHEILPPRHSARYPRSFAPARPICATWRAS